MHTGRYNYLMNRTPVEDRFWKYVTKGKANECWLWTGYLNASGYGRMFISHDVKPTNILSHRLSYQMHVGPIPDGLHICHTCDTPPCVNPKHLYAGTDADNVADRINRGRSRHHRPIGVLHPAAILTDEKVREILLATNERTVVLAEKYGVKPGTIYSVRERRAWKHVSFPLDDALQKSA